MARNVTEIIKGIRKKYGEASVIMGSELQPVKLFPTRLAQLDLHLGGGLPMGRISIIAGKPSSGKSSIAMQAASNFQKNGFQIVWVDLEKSFDVERAKTFDLDVSNIIYMKTSRDNILWAEKVRPQLQTIIQDFNASEDNRLFLVMDSLAANTIEDGFEKDAGKMMGGDAKANNQLIRNINTLLDDNQCFLLINEFREKMVLMGDPSYMPGGLGQYYFASSIIYTRGGEPIKVGSNQTGEIFKWTVKKSRTSPPKEVGEIKFDYVNGFDIEGSLIETAGDLEVIKKGGAGWYNLPNGEKVQGLDKFVETMKHNKAFFDEIEKQTYAKMPYPLYQSTIV